MTLLPALVLTVLLQSTPTPEASAELNIDLRLNKGQWDASVWELCGPDTNMLGAFAGDGLRFVLPRSPETLRPTGVTTRTPLVGDCECLIQVDAPATRIRSSGVSSFALEARFADGTQVRWALIVASSRAPDLRAQLRDAGAVREKTIPGVKGTEFTIKLQRSGNTWNFCQSSGFVDDPAIAHSDVGSVAPIESLQVLFEGSSQDRRKHQYATLKRLSLKASRPPRSLIAIETADDERIETASLVERDGAVQVGTDESRRLPLADVARIAFPAGGLPSIAWRGQVDANCVPASQGPPSEGMADLRLEISELPPAAEITRLRIAPRSAEPSTKWNLHAKGDEKPLVLRPTGPTTADVFFDPAAANMRGNQLVVDLELDGTSRSLLIVTCETDTDASRKFTAPEADLDDAPALAQVDFVSGDCLRGQIQDLNEESLLLKTSWGDEIKIPLIDVARIAWRPDSLRPSDEWKRRQAAPGAQDVAFVASTDGSEGVVEGVVHELSDGKLRFSHEGQDRSIRVSRLLGIVFAGHPVGPPSAEMHHVLSLSGKERITGVWQALEGEVATVQPSWAEAPLRIPQAQIREIVARNGRLAYLSDLTPAKVVETPYFSRVLSMRRDVSLNGDPLRVAGKNHIKGVSVHSRSAVTWQVDRRYQRFKTLVGFDDSIGLPASRLAAVDARVLGDGVPLWSQSDFRATSEPVPLDLDVSNVRQLTLEVDFGPNEDIADRVIWADARLLRAK